MSESAQNVVLSNCTKTRTGQLSRTAIWKKYSLRVPWKGDKRLYSSHLQASGKRRYLFLGMANRSSAREILTEGSFSAALSWRCTDPSEWLHVVTSAYWADSDIYLPAGIQQFRHVHPCILSYESLSTLDKKDQFQVNWFHNVYKPAHCTKSHSTQMKTNNNNNNIYI